MNKVILLGRIGNEPEVIYLQSGNTLCKFSFATSETYKKDGEKRTDTQWHNIVIFGKQAEIAEKYFTKGQELLIEGKIQYTTNEVNGEKKYYTNVLMNSFNFVGSKETKSESKLPDQQFEPAGPISDDEQDDLPF